MPINMDYGPHIPSPLLLMRTPSGPSRTQTPDMDPGSRPWDLWSWDLDPMS